MHIKHQEILLVIYWWLISCILAPHFTVFLQLYNSFIQDFALFLSETIPNWYIVQYELQAESRCKACSDTITYYTRLILTKQISQKLILYGLCWRLQCDSYYWHTQLLDAAANWQISPDALALKLKVHRNKQNLCIRTNIDLFICLTGRDTAVISI